jgi:hypothetical protein
VASRTVEIILKASDQFTDQTKKAQAQFAAMKIAADDFNKSVSKLQNLHPGLSADEAKSAAEALNRMKDASEASGKGFANASLAARGLGQELGITLPRAVTSFLAQTKLIGPALSGAFGVIAIVGLVEVLGQIPAAYEKISGAITGWDTKAKEAYGHFLEENKKAYDDLVKFQAKLSEIGGGPSAGNQVSLNAAQSQLASLATRETALRNAANRIRTGPIYERQPNGTDTLAPTTFEGMSPNELEAEADRINKLRLESATKVLELQRQGAVIDAESAQSVGDELIKQREEYKKFFANQLEPFKNQTFSVSVDTHDFRDAVIKDWKDILEAEQKGGDAYLEYQDYFAKQLEEFRIKPIGATADIEAGVKAGDENAKKIIKASEEAQKQQKEFVKTFQEGIGRAWDDFRQKGFGAFADLANYIAKRFTEGLLTNILFGSGGGTGIAASLGSIGIGGGSGGGLLSGIIGKLGINNGPLSEVVPGQGGGGILGSLFGGGISGLFTNNSAAANAAGGTLGLGVPGAGPGISGGISGVLGLNGGAGLLGLGAATLPVIGAVGGMLAIAIASFFGNHRNAPFTRDPNEITRTREYLFYSATQNIADAAKDIANMSHTFGTMPPGQVVKNGLPVALASSNQFRRQVNSVLQQDF